MKKFYNNLSAQEIILYHYIVIFFCRHLSHYLGATSYRVMDLKIYYSGIISDVLKS